MSISIVEGTRNPWNSLDCPDRPVRVEVDGVHIPVTKVVTDITKEGPANVNRLTEVFFPTEWEGTDVTQYIQSFDPSNQSDYDNVVVKWRGENEDEFEVVHFGYVRGVAGTDNSAEMKMWVSDPATLTTAIPYTGSFEREATADTVLRDVASTIEDRAPFSTVNVGIQNGMESLGPLTHATVNRQTYTGNRDTVKDALNTICERTHSRWYFEWREDGLTLVVDTSPLVNMSVTDVEAFQKDVSLFESVFYGIEAYRADESLEELNEQLREGNASARTRFIADAVDGGSLSFEPDKELTLIDNDAVHEILPINTIRVNGKGSQSSADPSVGERVVYGLDAYRGPSEKWPTAKVRYGPLYERAGQSEYFAGIYESNTRTIDETVNAARNKLKEALASTGEGDMTARGIPSIQPYDRVTALPQCADFLNQTPPLDYEVTQVTHKAGGDSNRAYTTRLKVTLFVDEKGIETVEARMATH